MVNLSFFMSHVSGPVWWFSVHTYIHTYIHTYPKKRPTYPQPTRGSRSGMTPESPWKIMSFQASLQGNESHENGFQGHPKSCKIDPGIIRNPLPAKIDFCNTSIAKGLFLQSQTPKFPLKNHQNKQLGNRYDKISFFLSKNIQKLPKWLL